MARSGPASLSRLALPRLIIVLLGTMSLAVPCGGGAVAGTTHHADPFQERVAVLEETGVLELEEALLLRFQHVFAPEELPEEFSAAEFKPSRCATDLVRSYRSQKHRLSSSLVQRLDGYLALRSSRASHVSPNGNFQLNYETSGEDAVPSRDEEPADGVPDFINKLGLYLEHSYTVEVLMMGFADPLQHGGPYQVFFRDMQTYGYTSADGSQAAGTVMVLHNDFEGFPPNDDPDGPVLGAAKVSAAHELKHASQYMGSQWAEGGWIELDAVWAEDLAYDQTNDFYNYLWGGSPIRNPGTPLDGGASGTGSYEDCVFQTCMQELWGVQVVVDFWERRAQHGGESVLDSYRQVIAGRGLDWPTFWATFTAWNYATAHRRAAGVGYEEAAGFPAGPVSAQTSAYPCQLDGEVEHLAASFLELSELGDEDGSLVLELDGEGGTHPLTAGVLITLADGSRQLEVFTQDEGPHTVGISLRDMDEVAVVVGNPDSGGTERDFILQATRILWLPEPLLSMEHSQLQVTLRPGESRVLAAEVSNLGEPGSRLNFQTSVWDRDPATYLAVDGDKSVAGSSLSASPATYLPGQAQTLDLILYNASPDEEWLRELVLQFPPGVNLLAAGPFRGGSLGDMEWLGQTGNGVSTSWRGESGTLGYGVLRGGETATATIEVEVADGLSEALVLAGTVSGDGFGFSPHSSPVITTLTRSWSQLSLTEPEASQAWPLGEPLEIGWEQDGTLDTVEVAFSRDGGQNWSELGQVPADQESFTWLADGEPTTNGLLRLTGQPGSLQVMGQPRLSLYPPSVWVSSLTPQGELDQGQSQDILLQIQAPGSGTGTLTSWLVVQADGPVPAGVVPVRLTLENVAPAPDLMPRATCLAGNVPNPFNPSTSLRFFLAEAGVAGLDILDVRGAVVRRLDRRSWAPGFHDVAWDGRDDRGRALPAGVYLARLTTPRVVATRKMLLAK